MLGAPSDLSDLGVERYPRSLLQQAQAVWRDRAMSEYRSIQIMTRFLSEIVAAGDPLDVYAGAVELIADEVRHAALCAQLCQALGAPATFPEPLSLPQSEAYARAPAAECALTTAISMLGVSETLSVGFIEDLAPRAKNPAIARVISATLSDEEGHREYGWGYIESALARFPKETLPDWRHLVAQTLGPHLAKAEEILAKVPPAERKLERFPDEELGELGLFSPPRQALVCLQTVHEMLRPRLRKVGLSD
jgi:hypothetical protein